MRIFYLVNRSAALQSRLGARCYSVVQPTNVSLQLAPSEDSDTDNAETSIGHPPPVFKRKYRIKMPVASIPAHIKAILDSHTADGTIGASDVERKLMRSSLACDNHADYFRTLLWLEEYERT